jgi:hypothetical protein
MSDIGTLRAVLYLHTISESTLVDGATNPKFLHENTHAASCDVTEDATMQTTSWQPESHYSVRVGKAIETYVM